MHFDQSPSLYITLQGPPTSACRNFLLERRRLREPNTNDEAAISGSALLQSIRAALRGRDEPLPTRKQNEEDFHHVLYPLNSSTRCEEELAWDDRVVCWSRAGIMQRHWDFTEFGDTIRWVCMGMLEQKAIRTYYSNHMDTPNVSRPAMPDPASFLSSQESNKESFGPFFRHSGSPGKGTDIDLWASCVYIFFRTSLRIYLLDGMEYSVSLPFIVRQAWPLCPHGVLMQREIDQKEIEEAELADEMPLPSLFTLTSPMAELQALGLAAKMTITPQKTWDVHSCEEQPTLPAEEMVIGVGDIRVPLSSEPIIVTVNVRESRLTIWHYAFTNPISSSSSQGVPLDQGRTGSQIANGESPKLSETQTSRVKSDASPVHRDGDIEMKGLPADIPVDPEARHDPLMPNKSNSYWVHCTHSHIISSADANRWRNASVRVFDNNSDGTSVREMIAIHFPSTSTLLIFECVIDINFNRIVTLQRVFSEALSIARVNCLRPRTYDIAVATLSNGLLLFALGPNPVPLLVGNPRDSERTSGSAIIGLTDDVGSCATLIFADSSRSRARFKLRARDSLVISALEAISMTIPSGDFCALLSRFLHHSQTNSTPGRIEDDVDCLRRAIADTFNIPNIIKQVARPDGPWIAANDSNARTVFEDDPVMRFLQSPRRARVPHPILPTTAPHPMLTPVFNTLHTWLEDQRLSVATEHLVIQTASLICDIGMVIRQEWADYWKRLVPEALAEWPSPHNTSATFVDPRLELTPIDLTLSLNKRINLPPKQLAPHGRNLGAPWHLTPSYAYGKIETLPNLAFLSRVYLHLSNQQTYNTRQRAQLGVVEVLRLRPTGDLSDLPLGVSPALHEASRTMQLIAVTDWTTDAYAMTGREDLAECNMSTPGPVKEEGYISAHEVMDLFRKRVTLGDLTTHIRASASGEVSVVSGVEPGPDGYSDACFGADRRLDEVARMLCSSVMPAVKMADRPEASEHETGREQQHILARVTERTMALPYGRALLTFATTPTLSQESFAIPKMEYTLRLLPNNQIINFEMHKPHKESLDWSEFHNGVAAGLRISPATPLVENSWIAFNRPTELTPQHAGFLMALGLTGHLKEMLTWQTFAYLTPKHELTSVGVLLGLSAAHLGSGNDHVIKLLAVHAPALLPHQKVDLNVPLVTQTAALAGVGLLYLGTKKRHMAEVLVNEISRKESTQQDVSNEHGEAYTLATGIAFGMVMLGKGTNIPRDNELVERLRTYIHGAHSGGPEQLNTFDTNLTSPAATIALGLMYLRTGRTDIADILAIPDAIVELHRIQPAFLLTRTLARGIIMWDKIKATKEWIMAQVPAHLLKAMEGHLSSHKHVDDALALAYYNIVAGACFAMALKFAGSQNGDALHCICLQYDSYNHLIHRQGTTQFDQRIRRSVLREGINLLGICMTMVAAGNGDLNCLRRLRVAFGQYYPPMRYGSHMSTHIALGLLFLGGGRYTLGTSDAAVASLIAAFYPRFNLSSADNKSYLQAMRHLWVIAVEPRALVTRDIDTREVIHVPAKILMQDMPSNPVMMLHMFLPKIVPDIKVIKAIKIDSPRYWPIYLDMANSPRARAQVVRSQTIWVKRKSAFLSYKQDSRGGRSFLVRNSATTADAISLESPTAEMHLTSKDSDDLSKITSFTRDPLFLAAADHLCSEDPDATRSERSFATYCRAALLDSLFQDKQHTFQTHVSILHSRNMSASSRFFHLRFNQLRACSMFYLQTYDSLFSGRTENNPRPPLIREATASAYMHAIEKQVDNLRQHPTFMRALRQYVLGESVEFGSDMVSDVLTVERGLAMYLACNCVPPITVLLGVRTLAVAARQQCLQAAAPDGTEDIIALDEGLKRIIFLSTGQLSGRNGVWTQRSLDEIFEMWFDGL